MNFLQKLESHTGGLVRIKSDLFWFGGRGWDAAPGRVCLLLDAVPVAGPARAAPAAARGAWIAPDLLRAAALLLIDDRPHWIWVANEDVELIT